MSNREDAVRTGFLGLNVTWYKMTAFSIGGIMAGVAGFLYAMLLGIVTPDILHWTQSAKPIIIVLLGGATSFYGPILGAIVFELINIVTEGIVQGSNIFIGILILAVVILTPEGVIGLFPRFKELYRRVMVK